MFKNARIYRIHSPWPDTEASLHTQLEHHAFTPCGSLSERSAGWESPAGNDDPTLARRVAGADLLRVRHQTRLLPPAAVNEALAERVELFKSRAQRDPSRKEKRELKEDTYAALLPKALLKSDRIHGLYLQGESLLAVDTVSDTQAELFMDQLRNAFGSLEATPLAFKKPIAELLQQVFLGKGPSDFNAARECRMQDPGNGGSTVSWMDMDLADAQVRRHVQTGLAIDRLGVHFDGSLGLVLDRDAVIRKYRYLAQDAMDDLPDEEPLAKLDAEIAMLAGSLTALCRALQKHQGGYA